MSVLPSHSLLLLITTIKKNCTSCYKLQENFNLSVYNHLVRTTVGKYHGTSLSNAAEPFDEF